MREKDQKVINFKIRTADREDSLKEWHDIKKKLDLRPASMYQFFGPQYRHIVRLTSPSGRQINIFAVYNVEAFLLWKEDRNK
jgi:hypothetical protein